VRKQTLHDLILQRQVRMECTYRHVMVRGRDVSRTFRDWVAVCRRRRI